MGLAQGSDRRQGVKYVSHRTQPHDQNAGWFIAG
jgi:hypothetical protein